MTMFRAIVLGIIQGATEFLPVSSSGHLVVIPAILGWGTPTLSFTMGLHVGTLLAVILYYIKDVIRLFKGIFSIFKKVRTPEEEFYLKLAVYIIVAMIPAGLFGVILSKKVELAFSSPHTVSLLFFVTAAILLLANFDFVREPVSLSQMSLKNALVVGFMQIVSLLPGVSRSGSTIAGGVYSGMKKNDAARFSFLLSIPMIFGASLFEAKDMFNSTVAGVSATELFVGMVVAFIVGLLSIRFFFKLVQKTKFYVFATYCVVIGIVGLILT
ncbi:MAG: undecaprenyl-diphosphatase UppP [Caldisericaceae bacterium]